jgi:hypothetical protein
MAESPHIPTLTDIALLPRWAKVLFLSRCATRVAPLIRSQWATLTAGDLMTVGMAGANADASARLGRKVLVGADPLPRLLELIETAEQQGSMAGYALAVCVSAVGLLQVEDAEKAASVVGQALERMILAYGASSLGEGMGIGSVWPDYAALRDAARAGKWDDQSSMPDSVLSELWPDGTPPGWPE